jgi:hypothetical protein
VGLYRQNLFGEDERPQQGVGKGDIPKNGLSLIKETAI